jgi:hypothetical protein
MVRTSQGLFMPTVESLFLSLVAYFALSAFMDQFMATDFSPALRSVLFIQLVLTILHAFSQLIISVTNKMVYVAVQSLVNEEGSGEAYAASSVLLSGPSDSLKEEKLQQKQEALLLLQEQAQEKANLLLMLASRTDY